ncbi:hypothetical protein ACIP88_37080 [Streptomyces uncialis]|uniref:hypothetical protein n=1 Tax=Streptomyces uncialis TaxID=1048205 RepID=UPI0038190366
MKCNNTAYRPVMDAIDVNPYGRFELDMNSRLDLDLSVRATVPGPRAPGGEAAVAPT